jgi:hypothetical protein
MRRSALAPSVALVLVAGAAAALETEGSLKQTTKPAGR